VKIAAIWPLKKVAPSQMTRKYNITVKAPPMLVCMKNTALGGCLEAKTALGKVDHSVSSFTSFEGEFIKECDNQTPSP